MLLEVSMSRTAERVEKIEKRLGMLPADRLESATVWCVFTASFFVWRCRQ